MAPEPWKPRYGTISRPPSMELDGITPFSTLHPAQSSSSSLLAVPSEFHAPRSLRSHTFPPSISRSNSTASNGSSIRPYRPSPLSRPALGSSQSSPASVPRRERPKSSYSNTPSLLSISVTQLEHLPEPHHLTHSPLVPADPKMVLDPKPATVKSSKSIRKRFSAALGLGSSAPAPIVPIPPPVPVVKERPKSYRAISVSRDPNVNWLTAPPSPTPAFSRHQIHSVVLPVKAPANHRSNSVRTVKSLGRDTTGKGKSTMPGSVPTSKSLTGHSTSSDSNHGTTDSSHGTTWSSTASSSSCGYGYAASSMTSLGDIETDLGADSLDEFGRLPFPAPPSSPSRRASGSGRGSPCPSLTEEDEEVDEGSGGYDPFAAAPRAPFRSSRTGSNASGGSGASTFSTGTSRSTYTGGSPVSAVFPTLPGVGAGDDDIKGGSVRMRLESKASTRSKITGKENGGGKGRDKDVPPTPQSKSSIKKAWKKLFGAS